MRFTSSFVVLTIALLSVSGAVKAQPGSQDMRAEILPKMHAVYQAFTELQPLLSSEDKFSKQSNEALISALLNTMRTKFGEVLKVKSRLSTEPGFESTLFVVNDMLGDSYNRFREGKKGYALWRLRTVSNYCISCHTRFEVGRDFQPAQVDTSGLNAYERGEFYLASRQFDKATESFLEAARSDKLAMYRIDALRKWLIIYTRVHPDPHGAIIELSKLQKKLRLNASESEELQYWMVSLRRWANESKAKIDPLRKAETLIIQGMGTNEPLSARSSAVELLRATSILHGLVEKGSGYEKKRSHVLYLLGLAYSELPFYFMNELPEMFLEQCIREYPGKEDARKSFRLYQNIVTRGFTGSGGTRLPDDVKLNLSELRKQAYQLPQLSGRL